MTSNVFCALILLTLSTYAHAARWFEVEFIAFEQEPNAQLREDFTLDTTPFKVKNELDILTEGFNRIGQKACLERNNIRDESLLSLDSGQQSPVCPFSVDYTQEWDVLPVSPSARVQDHMDHLYLLDSSQLTMQDALAKLKRKGLKPILHTGWRFSEQSERRAPNIVIYGGKRFRGLVSSEAVQNTIRGDGYAGLVQPEFSAVTHKEPDLWQLQGFMKIHVRHYLFITSQFDYRYRNNQSEIETARFSQYTRVYSGDIHYLDHPKMGMIIQIRKFKH
ncbi:hypothetical protein PALB_29890 [Pseudoalteromonas luteoviolacea B = ATCC 29581]|nr:hypothetical protein PALB_29890 [Pseudoalteromonas luteoviolacea B = ATCC 29581]